MLLCVFNFVFFPHFNVILTITEFQQVDGVRANYSGSMVALTEICLKPVGQDCATQSILQVLLHKFCFYCFTCLVVFYLTQLAQ